MGSAADTNIWDPLMCSDDLMFSSNVTLSDKGPSLETLDLVIPYFGSTPTFLDFDFNFHTS